MSDTDEETNSTSSDEEEEEEETDDTSSENEDDDDDDDDDEESDDDEHSSEEVIELIQVGDVRTAFSMATSGKNCCKFDQFPAVLETLNIKLNEKRTKEFFTMLDEDATDEVGWNSMFYALRDGQSKFKGLPMDQVVGGLLYEFASSARGRKRQQAVVKKSMISFMQTAGFKMEDNKDKGDPADDDPLSPGDDQQAGLDKPTRRIHKSQQSGSTEPTIREDEEADTFDISATGKPHAFGGAHTFTMPTGGRGRAGTASAVPKRPLFKNKSTGSTATSSTTGAAGKRGSIHVKEAQEPKYDLKKLKGPMGQILGDALSTQDEALHKLYDKIRFLEGEISKKYSHEDIVSGMNNVQTLQSAIKGIAKSSVESLKQDMNGVLNQSAVHSAHQVAKEISSQLTRMNHSINNTNKILSTQSGRDFEDKLSNLEEYLHSIDMNRAQMMARPGSRPLSTIYNKRGNSAKYPKASGMNKSVQFDFDQKALDSLGVAGMDKDDIEPIMDEMEVIKKGVSGLDDALQKIIADRLLKLEKTVFALFGQIASNKKDSVKLMPVEELVIQLDLQKANFEAEIRKVTLKNDELEKLLQHSKDTASREKQAAIDERERLLIALGRFLQQEAVVNELRGELKKKLGITLRQEHIEKLKKEEKKEKETHREEEEEDDRDDNDDDKKEEIDIVSAQKHIHLNNYEPDSKYDAATEKYEKKLLEHATEMQMKALKSILEYKSIDDIPQMDDDEIPDFLRMDFEDTQYDNDKILEQQLGFGYEELLRLYRCNTDLNVQLSFAKWERDALMQRLEDVKQPVIINTFGKATEVSLQLKLQSYMDQINCEQLELHKVRGMKKEMRLIDKYRLEMYRDSKKEEWKRWRDLREEKLEILRQKRMIKKLFEHTKLKAHKIMDEANDMRKNVKDEIERYSAKKHEMVLAKAKYEDKMSKNKIEMEEQFMNEEVAKHIEIYKQHLEDEAEKKANEERDEELESEKETLTQEFAEKMEQVFEDIEAERMEHEKEVKRLKHEIASNNKQMDEHLENQRRYMMQTNQIKKDKANILGQLKQVQQLYKDLQEEFKTYKEKTSIDDTGKKHDNSSQSVGGNLHMMQFSNGGNRQQQQPMGPIDPEALYGGYHTPSQELQLARKEYKKMKMASDQQAQQLKKLMREKAELSETIGRLETEIESQRSIVQKRDEELVGLQSVFDSEVSTKLRPFVKLVETVGRDVLHNAPTNYIFNYKKSEFSDMEDNLYRDRSDWYIHKNHILRCYFFSIEEWFRDHFWLHERIVQCNQSVHEAMQQVLMDTWMETRIQSHAFIRWFGDLDYQQELKLFYSVQFNQEERYFWNMDMYEIINDYRSGVIDKYYKDTVAEREERREGYWKRHPDVYALYKKRNIETVKRYKKKMQEKKHAVEYMKKEKLEILQENDLSKIQQEFAKIKQANKLKRESSRGSGLIMTDSASNKTPRLSSNPSGSSKSIGHNKRGSAAHNQLKRHNSKQKNIMMQ